MAYPQIAMLAIGIVLLAIASFALGWDVAETRERRANANRERQFRAMQAWIREQWPESEVGSQRWLQGYQTGILHSPELSAASEDE